MKKILYPFFVLPIFIISCSKSPNADFYVEINKAKIGAEVFFRNTSDNADSYEWDFGDGSYLSIDKDPVHIYKTIGTYTVTLTAISKKGKTSKATKNLTVVEPTLLVIEVLEYYKTYPVKDASVILYPTLRDWDNRTRRIVEGFTDNGGVVVFGGLNSGIHFVNVWEQFHDNHLLRDEDPAFIEAEVLHEKIQWFVAWVDYYPPEKGNAHGEKKMVIKKLEKREFDKTYQSSTYNGEIDYETLLKMSVERK